MRMYRVVFLLAAVLIVGLFAWTVGHQPIGAKEEQSIEAQ